MDFVERAEADEGIRKGLATIEAGKSKPARKAISAIMERRALSR
jgi:predicted transcriptional regulator